MRSDQSSRWHDFQSKLNRVQQQVDVLQAELRQLRQTPAPHVREEASTPPAPPLVAATAPTERLPIKPKPPAVSPDTRSTTESKPPPAAPPPPAPHPTVAYAASTAAPRGDWESVIGGHWMNRIGVLTLLLAGAFLVHLSWQRGWVSPPLQVASIFAAGVGLLVAGERFQRRGLPVFAQGLTALGIFTLYAGGFVGLHLHHVFSHTAAFVIYVLITATAFPVAARTNSVAVVLLGLLGGYLTPVIVSTGTDAAVELFTYLLFLNGAIVATGITKRWSFLTPIALGATALMFGDWYLTHFTPDKRWVFEWMLSLHAAGFMVAAIVPYAALRRAASRLDLRILTTASMTFFGITCLLFRGLPEHHLGEFAALYAVGHWLLAGVLHRACRRPDRLLVYLLGLGAVYLTAAVPLYFGGDHRAVAWAAQALVFTIIGIRYSSRRTLASATVVYGFAACWTFVNEIIVTVNRGTWLGVDARFGTVAIVATLIAAAGLAYRLGRKRLEGVKFVDAPYFPLAFAIAGDLLLMAGAIHQFHDGQLALVWTVNALAVTALTAYWRDPVGESVGLLLFVPAFVRFLDYQAGTALPTLWVAGLDVRFVQGLAVVGAAWLAARLVRHGECWPDLPHRSVLALLAGDALLLVVLGLQFEGAMLTVTWAANALGLIALARWTNRPKLAWAATAALALTAARWLLDDAMSDALTPWLTAARQGFLSGLAVVAAGWIGASLFVGRSPRRLASLLALAVNLLLLIVIAHQWDGYAVLALWTIDVAVLWLAGFARRHPPARFEALLLWVSVLPVWIMLYGLEWSRPLAEFHMLVNPRFGALALVGLVGVAATWAYQRRLARRADTESDEPGPRREDPAVGIGDLAAQIEGRLVDCERNAHLVCVVLANLVLVAALTVDVQTLYDRYASLGGAPFRDLTMARQATLSVVWAAYAATLFVVGFACRYAPVRILAMVGLAPILAKVFLVDLRDLDVIYRVLSFAVLGGVFIGVSYLYQRYRPRIGVTS